MGAEHGHEGAGEPDTVREAFEAMPVALASVSGPDHLFTAANAAYRTLVGQADVVGRSVRETFHEAQADELVAVLDRAVEQRRSQSGTEWRVPPLGGAPGSEIFVDFVCVPRIDASGTVAAVDAVVVDVTQRVAERRITELRIGEAERRCAEAANVLSTLQDALLPPGVPVIPGLTLCASYLMAEENTAAGGDWCEALPLGDHRVALVVGDVVGHGISASATMARLRAVLSERLTAGVGVAAALGALDRWVAEDSAATMATLCVAVLDTVTGGLSYCTAGHPPPLVVDGDGATYLPISGTGPLGTGTRFSVAEHLVSPGGMLVLYTDGLLERPDISPAAASVELLRVVGDTYAAPGPDRVTAERMCRGVLELTVGRTGHRDDVTLLVAQRGDPPAALHLELPAAPVSVGVATERLSRWLAGLRVRSLDVVALGHATRELVSNAVEHAYASDEHGVVTIDAELSGTGVAQVSVSDRGRWRARGPTEHRGRGLTMAHGLSDELVVRPGPAGTAVVLRHRLSRDVDILASAPGGRRVRRAARATRPAAALEVTESPGVLTLTGPLDGSSAHQLRSALVRAFAGGTRKLVVDLTGTTRLASAGLQVLAEFGATAEDSDVLPGITLVAPAGTPAQQVLETVRLRYLDPGSPP